MMTRKTLPILLCVLLLAGFALAQDSTIIQHAPISAKVEATIEALMVVVLMIVRGMSDPKWRTTFLNLTNAVGLVSAVNTAVMLWVPLGIPQVWQSLIARGLAVLAMYMFGRKEPGEARIASAFSLLMGKPAYIEPPKLPEPPATPAP